MAPSLDPVARAAPGAVPPPRLLAHAVLAVAALPLLWAVSVPGVSLRLLLLSLLLWCMLGAL